MNTVTIDREKKVTCAMIPVSFIDGADFTVVPLWLHKDCEYESHMFLDEVICAEIEYRECYDELKEIETKITYGEFTYQYLIDIGCLLKKKAIPTPEPESNEDWKDRYCVNCCCAFDDLGKKCTERNNCDSHNFIHQLIQAERQKAISIMDECIERPKGIVPDSYHLFDAIEREK